jgi:hypothetical protein
LVHQAEGRPGLAVTLCDLCRREGVRGIALADALSRDLRTTFERLVGHEATDVLAAFAAGGEAGMPIAVVAQELGLTPVRLRHVVAGLAAGGVLTEVAGSLNRFVLGADLDCLVVRPEALRQALVRDVFFDCPGRLPVKGLLARAPNPDSVARTLIGACHREGRVGFDLLTEWVERAVRTDTWQWFAWLGPRESCWVLRQHPEQLRAVAYAGLHHAPAEVIPRLLAEEAKAPCFGRPEGGWALGEIRHWIHGARPGTGEPTSRREVLLRATLLWLDRGGCLPVAVQALCLAISPDYQEWDMSPGDRDALVHASGFASPEEMAQIQALWPAVRDRLRAARVEDWSPVEAVVCRWGWPGVASRGNVTPAQVERMVGFARQMLGDLGDMAGDRPGLLHWVSRLAWVQEVPVPAPLDPDFVTLFPTHEPEDWREGLKEQAAAARDLARRWEAVGPAEVASRLAFWEAEMGRSEGRTGPRWSAFVCEEIAVLTTTPADWVEALHAAGAPGDLAAPFLGRAVALRGGRWAQRLAECLDQPLLQGAALAVVLQLPDPPPDLLTLALDRACRWVSQVETLCLRGAVPEPHVLGLLRHPDPAVARAAARGEWHADPTGSVRPSLQAAWREAVLQCQEGVPEGAFAADPTLARDWLAVRPGDAERVGLWQECDTAEAASTALTPAQRVELLGRVPEEGWLDRVVQSLVGDDPAVYRQLLAEPRLWRHHLTPLRGRPSEAWATMAVQALNAGRVVEDVARAAFGGFRGWVGSESELWVGWGEAFKGLSTHADPRIRRVGEIGAEDAQAREADARRRERHEAIYG